MKPTFQNTLENLTLFNDDLSSRCVSEMEKGTVLFSSGIKSDHTHLKNLYKTRLNTAQTINKEKFTELELASWSSTVDILNASYAKNLLLGRVQSETRQYFIFWDADKFEIVSLFYLVSKTTIQDTCLQNDEYINRGLTVSSIKYIDGQKAKDWN
ncbi:MAG: hypothetical protein ACJA1C_002000 [Crocinitomicaceae bacterium]|jgi:hypothetical protein